jgi:hypothetical protein
MVLGALIAAGAGWVAVLASLLLDFLGIRRLPGSGRRWQACGILLSTSGIFVDALTEARAWPPSQLRDVHVAMLPVVLAGLVVLLVGLTIQARSAVRSPKGR